MEIHFVTAFLIIRHIAPCREKLNNYPNVNFLQTRENVFIFSP